MNFNTTSKILLLIIGILILLFVTNPSHEKHKEKIGQKYAELNPITGIFGVGDYVAQVTSYNDCYLYSYTKFVVDFDSRRVVSFGVLGMVFIITDVEIK